MILQQIFSVTEHLPSPSLPSMMVQINNTNKRDQTLLNLWILMWLFFKGTSLLIPKAGASAYFYCLLDDYALYLQKRLNKHDRCLPVVFICLNTVLLLLINLSPDRKSVSPMKRKWLVLSYGIFSLWNTNQWYYILQPKTCSFRCIQCSNKIRIIQYLWVSTHLCGKPRFESRVTNAKSIGSHPQANSTWTVKPWGQGPEMHSTWSLGEMIT